MQVSEREMVRGEYPVPEEGKKEDDMEEIIAEASNPDNDPDNLLEEIIAEASNPDNVNEEMDCAEDEEHPDDIRCLEEDVYSDIGIKALEDELDHLETALDHLEKKNDDIHAELIELLQSNREARKQFQESLQNENQQSQ
ncbi:UPF0184 protein C9orf16 [Camponotus floridanus]|uniref:UPF0184 protein C9orf16 n=1 Tax=Camponotus floridanus TaxID=104421 RepID=E1ZYH6_CAMFO|nr:UPF0184 protein AAEL002161 [Camponotus floridanus]EFN73773.1 UPF0184 protein C9orf16 [Camponotus floridanus]